MTFVHAGQDHAYCPQGSQSHDTWQSMVKDHRILVYGFQNEAFLEPPVPHGPLN